MNDNKWNDILTSCDKATRYSENIKHCTNEEEFSVLLFNYMLNELDIKYQFMDFTEDLLNTNDKLIDLSQQNLKFYKRKNLKLTVENILLFIISFFLILKLLHII